MKPLNLQQAAINLNLRHKMVTGEDQHIGVKTLDDYYDKIKCGSGPGNPYDFKENKDELVKCLRKHCVDIKEAKSVEKVSN